MKPLKSNGASWAVMEALYTDNGAVDKQWSKMGSNGVIEQQ
jgi:hypothetical protein